MRHLATWRGRPRAGIGHAAAAAVEAERAGSAAGKMYAADATATIGDVARRTALGRSQRVTQPIGTLRAMPAPWERTRPVRELDARLAAYGPARRRV
ncbi:MAG TPA: hypothetical protein VGP02_09530 [Mycobacteriales bacterium]|jgi:hypothetical protein|nr:hypothetical protein [Mycobacteriales bacterium]